MTAVLEQSVAPSLDWSAFYTDLQDRAQVPGAARTDIDANHAVFQAMYLDLGEIHRALVDSGFSLRW